MVQILYYTKLLSESSNLTTYKKTKEYKINLPSSTSKLCKVSKSMQALAICPMPSKKFNKSPKWFNQPTNPSSIRIDLKFHSFRNSIRTSIILPLRYSHIPNLLLSVSLCLTVSVLSVSLSFLSQPQPVTNSSLLPVFREIF